MKNIAIICEYNPMHNGHIHQINEIKKIYPNSRIIALMSGSFVQRGEVSILNKFDKAEIAIKNGIDLVIEIPNIISLQSADYFSHYCVKIIDELNIVDYISFGIEDDINKFNSNINSILFNEDKIFDLQKKYIDNGESYKKSFIMALDDLQIDSSILKKPNNTLAFLYIKALKKLKSSINILPIQRHDGGYESDKLDNFIFQSASTIRNEFKNNSDISKFVPIETFNKLKTSKLVEIDDYSNIFYYKSMIEKKSPKDIAGYENGILNLLLNNFNGNLIESIHKSHNRRYSITRLNRFIFNYLLDITNDDIKSLNNINYILPLKFNKIGTSILRDIKENSIIEIINDIVKYTEDIENQRYLDIDIKAYKLANFYDFNILNRLYKEIPYVNK